MPQQRLVEPIYVGTPMLSTGTVVAPSGDPLRFPSVSMTMPTGPLLDLGIVIMPPESRGGQHALLAIADRLGADGFVVESRAMTSVYTLSEGVAAAVASGQQSAVTGISKSMNVVLGVASVAALLTGCASSSSGCPDLHFDERGRPRVLGGHSAGDAHTYLRAFRRSAGAEARVIPESIALNTPLRELLEGVSTQAEQLVALHALLARGLVSVHDYGILRAVLSQQG